MMRFQQIDAIRELQPGERIVAVKSLSLAEDYLKDHFPRFPVMPGVVMLEAMYQAAAWLVRVTEDFAHSMVTLQEAKNVKFADFVQPGDQLTVTCQSHQREARTWAFKAEGWVRDRMAVRARLVLARFNLGDERAELAIFDRHITHSLRQQFHLICPSGLLEGKAAASAF